MIFSEKEKLALESERKRKQELILEKQNAQQHLEKLEQQKTTYDMLQEITPFLSNIILVRNEMSTLVSDCKDRVSAKEAFKSHLTRIQESERQIEFFHKKLKVD